MSTLNRKAWGDLTRHRSRTLLAVFTLCIATASLGFFAVPSLLNAAMNRQIQQSHLFDVGVPTRILALTPAELSALGHLPGITAVGKAHRGEVAARHAPAVAGRTDVAEVQRERGVLHRGERGHELEELEDDADVVAAPDGELLLGHLIQAAAVDRHRAGGGPVDARDEVDDGRLAAARRAGHRHHLAASNGQVHAVQRAEPNPAAAVRLLHSR